MLWDRSVYKQQDETESKVWQVHGKPDTEMPPYILTGCLVHWGASCATSVFVIMSCAVSSFIDVPCSSLWCQSYWRSHDKCHMMFSVPASGATVIGGHMTSVTWCSLFQPLVPQLLEVTWQVSHDVLCSSLWCHSYWRSHGKCHTKGCHVNNHHTITAISQHSRHQFTEAQTWRWWLRRKLMMANRVIV